MPARLHVDAPLQAGLEFDLPAGAARHVQVLRHQPGDLLILFNGQGGEWQARVVRMGRSDVRVQVGEHDPVERELPLAVTLAAVMPANDRFDWLIEKATELGAAVIEPLMSERSVLRLNAERADKKRAHWQAIAVAAAEQCGRTRVPHIAAPRTLAAALAGPDGGPDTVTTLALSLSEARPLAERLAQARARAPSPLPALRLYSGPEGGFSPAEEDALRRAGALPTTLGPRVLRAETAPLAALGYIGLTAGLGDLADCGDPATPPKAGVGFSRRPERLLRA
ncbi:16S rRNA (uracil(1498)-N(3))-methyltransferase [Leptothrix discophora]|uniref:Ribosomal RNA small subunit methyltransferase E n=1 Tax=Leptothrix discophora TaxID=89 RepID=A0ABT9G5I8_LEPDI|nr:16S rRNA (uracil(1498)-N(3))-methyltransferase [Leptothrix discophora]MDP4301665.1 16S rRNA (uracil(1498)-N(3))-methyltransferase [Leptothrix discophora]